MKSFIFWFFTIIGLGSFALLGFFHEQVHVAIMEDYGIKSRIEYFRGFPDLLTISEKPCPTDTCHLAHEISDAIGYHFIPITIIVFFGLLIIIALLDERRFKKWDFLEKNTKKSEQRQ